MHVFYRIPWLYIQTDWTGCCLKYFQMETTKKKVIISFNFPPNLLSLCTLILWLRSHGMDSRNPFKRQDTFKNLA